MDFASILAAQPLLLGGALGTVGILLFMLLGRKSYGKAPGAIGVPWLIAQAVQGLHGP